MKKNKLVGSFEVDFDLYGIVSNAKEYKLAWNLNHALEISLTKQDDVNIEFSDHSSILISCYLYQTDNMKIELLSNKLVAKRTAKANFLLPELNQFDYLLKCRDMTGELDSENVIGFIRDLALIEYVAKLNFDDLKSKENLLY